MSLLRSFNFNLVATPLTCTREVPGFLRRTILLTNELISPSNFSPLAIRYGGIIKSPSLSTLIAAISLIEKFLSIASSLSNCSKAFLFLNTTPSPRSSIPNLLDNSFLALSNRLIRMFSFKSLNCLPLKDVFSNIKSLTLSKPSNNTRLA